jgi:diketogulonate reductase-like aldo/keto reductase
MEFISVKDAKLPALGLGTWALNGRGCFSAVKDALDAKRGAGRVVDPAGWGPEWDGP